MLMVFRFTIVWAIRIGTGKANVFTIKLESPLLVGALHCEFFCVRPSSNSRRNAHDDPHPVGTCCPRLVARFSRTYQVCYVGVVLWDSEHIHR